VSDKINDGGHAFPCNRTVGPTDGVVEDARAYGTVDEGMTLRDWFAGQVQVPNDMGWVASALMGEQPPRWSIEGDYETSLACAKWWADARARYRLMDAEAMLKARN
jgi:hypothetical protein